MATRLAEPVEPRIPGGYPITGTACCTERTIPQFSTAFARVLRRAGPQPDTLVHPPAVDQGHGWTLEPYNRLNGPEKLDIGPYPPMQSRPHPF
ncbi:hypothetical protein ETD83_38980 [Actinomadura soli]|uniref:Uncharacterized protein n=1 Tax=Actinomadura soli TaxID=2508997 RepID=A0A5C4IZF0_9ACTN|nr:hypothetical protein ETD83_38980 [Actinomadura soli]